MFFLVAKYRLYTSKPSLLEDSMSSIESSNCHYTTDNEETKASNEIAMEFSLEEEMNARNEIYSTTFRNEGHVFIMDKKAKE